MKIATWNVERLKHRNNLDEIIGECNRVKANILVLTETDERVRPDYKYCYQTPNLSQLDPDYYKSTENRVSIFTNYKCVQQYSTYDEYTAICVELETEEGNLLVYGTILGIYGNRHENFKTDLPKQLADYQQLSNLGRSICICGDYNLSFSDNYYFTNYGRNSILECFSDNKITLLTESRPECIDHIAVSDRFVANADVSIEEWNYEKTLSDHKGIVTDIIRKQGKV